MSWAVSGAIGVDRGLLQSSTPMRLALALALALVTVAPVGARAEAGGADAPKARERVKVPPYRLVRIMPDTGQALLLDRGRGKHLLVDAGAAVGGYEVTEIGNEHVVLARAGDTREFVLVAGEAPTTRLADPYPMALPPPTTAPATALLDPYPAGVLDPYGGDGVREVQAPKGQRASDAPPPPPAPPPPTKKAEPLPPAAPPATSFTVARAELDAGLGDFARIGKEVEMRLVAGGVQLDRVSAGSFFHTMGLRDGDLVKKVDGTAIKALDDAARVYARLGKVKRFTVEIDRAGAPLTLRYQITK